MSNIKFPGISIIFFVLNFSILGLSKDLTNSETQFAFAQVRDGSTCSSEIDLNGVWEFKATDEDKWLEARVPSTVWTDLMQTGRIDIDPYYRDNELKVQWVEKKEWEYRKDFEIDEDFLKHDKIVLDCRGLDTITEIYLNGTLLVETLNMFIEYEFDIKPLLRIGENQIHIIFRSVLEWNRKHFKTNPKIVWENEKGNLFMVRREGSDFGWDWGVRLSTCGIWRPIRVAAYDIARITDLGVRQNLSDPQKAVLNVTTEIEQFNEKDLDLEVQIFLNEEMLTSKEIDVEKNTIKEELIIENPKLWWPNGWGDHPLYTVVATLKNTGKVIHTKRIKIGLRTVEIVREKDKRGETFGIKVNGNLIFCKGANWIPADALPDRLTEAHYKHLLRSCVETNMNMLRIWAGGIYEPDIFYEFCDEHGLMLWHDFMFAIGPYLAEESFLKNVREEISSVVRRLRHHPSIAIWCGNNEQESAMPKWAKNYKTVTWEDFDKIFYETIPQATSLYDPDRPYWPGSPHHPLDRERDTDGYEANSGDAHIWDCWHGGQPFSWYVDNVDVRFVSEYGFQSIPVMETIRSFTAPEDRYFVSHILDHHNKAGKKSKGNANIGNVRIARYMSTMYKMPKSFEDWIYVSQVMHCESMKVSTEAYRRNYPNTTGALYWQVNDNWPTISGSGIDYYGRWKALQYIVRHFFNPVLVTGWVEGTEIKIWGVNDHLQEIPVKLEWVLAKFDGTKVKKGKQKLTLPPNNSTMIAELDFEKEVGENPEYATYRKESYENRRQFYIAYKLVRGDDVLSQNVSYFVFPKYFALIDPDISYTLKKDNDHTLIDITSKQFAAYVELGLKNSYARFSDNYFCLLPGEKRRIRVIESEIPSSEFEEQFYVKSLIDSYK
jgi:beta-mannosidase